MSKCCCNNDVKFFQKPNAGICDVCHPAENKLSPMQETAMCPPIGEPRLLTLVAPVVFDESGINLCRTIDIRDLEDVCRENSKSCTNILFDGISKRDLCEADKIQLQVVDIDFNFLNPCDNRYSEIRPAKGNPNLSRITLKDIDVTFAVKTIDCCCRVAKEGMMTVRYLGDECDYGFDPCTNPSCISFDLYTPYGLAYAQENPAGCNKLVPTINYMGFVSSQVSCDYNQNMGCTFSANNTIQQGISAQALAKVVASDDEEIAIGLTLYIKSIYFVQYKFRHEGLNVPQKISPVEDEEDNSCLDFVCGDLLETNIQPLEFNNCRRDSCDRQKHDCGCNCAKCSCAKCACNKAAAMS